MPTASDSWVVEAVVQYRYLNGTEQWLIKWKDEGQLQFGEDHNTYTWEPWENLLTDEAQAEARKAKTHALPSVVSKLTVALLRKELAERNLETGGLKTALIARLLAAL